MGKDGEGTASSFLGSKSLRRRCLGSQKSLVMGEEAMRLPSGYMTSFLLEGNARKEIIGQAEPSIHFCFACGSLVGLLKRAFKMAYDQLIWYVS